MKRIFAIVLWVSFTHMLTAQTREYTMSFEIFIGESGIPLDNAQIAITPCNCGGVTNRFGRFSIVLPQDTYDVSISFIGYTQVRQTVELNNNVLIRTELYEAQEQLSEVIVRAKKVLENVETPQMGVLQLTSRELQKIPAAIGEYDVLRGMTLLAGVNNAGEISNGLSVRGGSLDQNLILYDYAPVFNPTHLFGLFSVFTPDVLSTIDLYRANIPARYGGRSTSVLDVKVKNPFVDKTTVSGGIGLVSSRLAIETPLVEDKLFLNVGGRIGFTDFLLPLVSDRLENTKARFSDATMKLLFLPTDKDQISLTGFYSKDFYQLDLISRIQDINSSSNQYDFFALNGTLNWTHSFDEDTNLRSFFVGSLYTPKTIFPEQDNPNEIVYESNIRYLSFFSEFSKKVKEDMDYYLGLQATQYQIKPGELDPGTGNSINPVTLDTETSYEFAAFSNLNWKPAKDLTVSGGLRFNHYVFVGPYTQATFDENSGALLSTKEFEKGAGVKTYNGLEPRVGLNYKLGERTAVKASYARLNQYLQNIYNTTTPLPTSRWKTADPNIEPQTSDTYGLGLYQNLGDGSIELSVEGYYRDSKNVLTYKPGADFFLEEFIERDVVQGIGEAYGVEFSFKKPEGRFNGWINYTWARSFIRSQNEKLADRVNNNEWFPSDFDRPHVFNSTINFEADKYNTWSFNFTAQTGRPYTVANSVFELEEIDVPIFIERNNARLRPYHRLDFSWKIKYSKRPNRKWKGDWTFTIYNLYSRRNPFNLYYTQRTGAVDGDVFGQSPLGSYELAVLNSPLFAVTYNFVFD
ncbi:TonB-dependent receptor [Poritiphilus flavus]|uniref:TonB-dependent receptor n=1 Tax=Poritiphilus flavus TaxID=2697053 RepID=A0A6L9E6M5_9FLAO|nr:TonB-dependent receptor [Poritiphilus flavus]NAS10377.1 TonB-dependent receptor [Poritiphilus flavus]